MSSRQLYILGWSSEESSGLDIQISVYMSSATMMVIKAMDVDEIA